MLTRPFPIAIIGLGYWGSHLVRVSRSLGLAVYGYDNSPLARTRLHETYPDIHILPSVRALGNMPKIRAVIIATPSHTHFAVAKLLLGMNKHILIEKPLTQNAAQAHELLVRARKSKTILMVDHTFLYSQAVIMAKKELDRGTIGTVRTVVSIRLGGIVRPNSSVLWDLAPHDVSIANFLLGKHPVSVSAESASTGKFPDAADFTMTYADRTRYHGIVSWQSDKRIRRITCIGTHGTLYIRWNARGESVIVRKDGTSRTIPLPTREPLRTMLERFMDRISGKDTENTDAEGEYVVRVIDTMHRSYRRQGAMISL